MPGRDTSTFTANVTASLRICHKNAIVDDGSMAYEVAKHIAKTTYTHAISPLVTYAYQSFFMPEAITTAPTTAIPKKLTHQEKVKRRLNAEQDSTQLNEDLKQLELIIKPLFSEKKALDAIEKNNKDQKIEPVLTKKQLKRKQEILETIDDCLLQKVRRCKGLIEEHCMRRLDITFLLMIALYKKNVVIQKGKTDRQHGKGSKETGTAGCHASLVPHPVLSPMPKKNTYASTPLSDFTLYQQFFKRSPQKNQLSDMDLQNCYLYDLLNLTNELPTIVNEFDGHMEGKWIPSSAVESLIDTLNLVAKGDINPVEGINRYGSIMALFFSHINYRYVTPKPKYTTVQSPNAFNEVWQYQRHATLSMFSERTVSNVTHDQTHEIHATYLHLMLNFQDLTPSQRIANTLCSSVLEQRFLDMQQEIWDSPSRFTNRK